MMKLDRNINSDGKGKYALVRLRTIQNTDEAYALLRRLEALGVLDWGCVGQPDEFFVIKLRDKFAPAALEAYSKAVIDEASAIEDEKRAFSLFQYGHQVHALCERAGTLSEFCKEPD
jgi:hypothetical protein